MPVCLQTWKKEFSRTTRVADTKSFICKVCALLWTATFFYPINPSIALFNVIITSFISLEEAVSLYLHEFILHLLFNYAKENMCYIRTLVYMIECKALWKHSVHQNIQNICTESAIRTYLVKCSCLLNHAKYLCLILLWNFKGFMI